MKKIIVILAAGTLFLTGCSTMAQSEETRSKESALVESFEKTMKEIKAQEARVATKKLSQEFSRILKDKDSNKES